MGISIIRGGREKQGKAGAPLAGAIDSETTAAAAAAAKEEEEEVLYWHH